MAYKSLYRKYRPKTFDEVSGQNPIIKTLQNSIKENKISHAFLFSGTRGTGKTTVAKIFAKTINCFNLKEGKPCEKCEVCQTINTDEIQDIIEIDAASNNGVDEIRELKNKVNLVPTSCKYKVYIIDEVHMLSIGAFNALLKTLEEPPAHAIFILATTEPQKIPITILSRCQRYDFKKISIENLVKRLEEISKKENIEITKECLCEISKLGDGSMRDSIGILEQVFSFADNKITMEDIYEISGSLSSLQIANLIIDIKEQNIEKVLDLVEILNNSGKDFMRITEDLMLFSRNLLIYIKAPKYFEEKNNVSKEEIKEISNKITEEFCLKLIEELNKLIFDMKKSSNLNIMFELFLFKVVSDNLEKEPQKTKAEVTTNENVFQKPQTNLILEKDKTNEELNITTSEEKNKSEIKLDFSNLEKTEIDLCKKALLNNTIALAEKEEMKEVSDSWKKLQTFLIDKNYKDVATILLDSKITAVSKTKILLTYKYDCLVEEHDKEKTNIEKLIKEITGKKYETIAVTESCWKDIRPHYVDLKKKKKKIELMEEIPEEEKPKKTKKNKIVDSAIDIFGEDIVEMEG